MNRLLRFFVLILVIIVLSISVSAQDNISLLRVSYNTTKTQNPPSDELKPLIDKLEQTAQQAVSDGNPVLAAYSYRKGTFLLRGGKWTPEKAFEYSINLKTGNLFVCKQRSHYHSQAYVAYGHDEKDEKHETHIPVYLETEQTC